MQIRNLLRGQKLRDSKVSAKSLRNFRRFVQGVAERNQASFYQIVEKILGKENTRRQYDLDLKYQKYQPSYTHNSQYAQYGSQWEYEVRSAGGPWPPPQQPKSQLGFIIAMICFGLGLLQFIVMLYSLKVRKFVILRNAQIENNYENIRNAERIKTNTSAIKDLDSLEDLGKYLTEDSN
ncbi:uncharacterized protein [Cardiocondyla obscurior]|uniref:uncharacterized protein isoform X2 n=1 Tax=Cardiocondyla obscurior TaxID=286306 RepID=UPI00396560CF